MRHGTPGSTGTDVGIIEALVSTLWMHKCVVARGMHPKTYSESHCCEVFRVTSVCHHGHVRVLRREVL